jgi:hypothetical protein
MLPRVRAVDDRDRRQRRVRIPVISLAVCAPTRTRSQPGCPCGGIQSAARAHQPHQDAQRQIYGCANPSYCSSAFCSPAWLRMEVIACSGIAASSRRSAGSGSGSGPDISPAVSSGTAPPSFQASYVWHPTRRVLPANVGRRAMIMPGIFPAWLSSPRDQRVLSRSDDLLDRSLPLAGLRRVTLNG